MSTPRVRLATLALISLFGPVQLSAQNKLEFELVLSDADHLEVILHGIATSDLTDLSSLCFALRCGSVSDAYTLPPVAVNGLELVAHIENRVIETGRYSVYYIVGEPSKIKPNRGAPAASGGVTVARIPVEGKDACSAFSIAQDPHTADLNADLYVSVSGVDRTGSVRYSDPLGGAWCLKKNTGPDNATNQGCSVFPNPCNTGMINIRWPDPLSDVDLVSLSLEDAIGREVLSARMVSKDLLEAGLQIPIPATFHGIAFLRLVADAHQVAHRIVVQ